MPSTKHFASQKRIVLPGSEKSNIATVPPTVKAHAVRDTKPAKPPKKFTVTVLLRRKNEVDPAMVAQRTERVTRKQFAAKYGAATGSVRLVEAFAEEYGLKAAAHTDAGRRHVSLTGTEGQMQKAFGVTLSHEQVGPHLYRVREGSITLPEELEGHVVAVLGLDNRPQAKPHSRAAVPHASNLSYTPPQVSALYNFPGRRDGEQADDRHHRAGRRICGVRPDHLLPGTRPAGSKCRRCAGRRRYKLSGHGYGVGRRGDARYRGVCGGGAGSEDCRLLCA